jgi:hypothetical protein
MGYPSQAIMLSAWATGLRIICAVIAPGMETREEQQRSRDRLQTGMTSRAALALYVIGGKGCTVEHLAIDQSHPRMRSRSPVIPGCNAVRPELVKADESIGC